MDENKYFHYLQNISWKGKLYRDYFVYPLIERWCKGNVLDLGCGVGNFLKRKPNYVGVDINKDCVNFCVQKGLNAVPMNVDELPFSNNTFHTIILDNVLEHISEPSKLVNEIKRVLCTYGRIIILVPGEKGYDQDDDHKSFYNKNDLIELASKFNLEVEKTSSIPLPFLSKIFSFFCFFAVLKLNESSKISK